MNLLLFSVGAALGAPIRFWLDNYFRPRYQLPVGIMIANVIGSFAIGFIASAPVEGSEYLLLGFCGALTTWSTFIVDLYLGYKNRKFQEIILNLPLSLALGFAAFILGKSLI